jgi:hypothetical protein
MSHLISSTRLFEGMLVTEDEYWVRYEQFVLDNLLIPHMTNTVNYAGLGLIEEGLELLESIRTKPYSEDNLLEGGDFLFYAVLLQHHRPHLNFNFQPTGFALEDTNEYISMVARFAKVHSHYLHGRKGSDDYDRECRHFVNSTFQHIVHYCKGSLHLVAGRNVAKLQDRHSS